jgi:allantoinase
VFVKPRRYGPFPYRPIIDRPPVRWPDGARLAVWLIPNIEFFPLDGFVPAGGPKAPNVLAWSQRDYGNQVGVYRLMEVMAERGIRGTAALNADICTEHPRIVEQAQALGWEFMGHCESNARPLDKVLPGEERQVIANTLKTIEAATGSRPTGWLGAGLSETWDTLDHLAAEGVRYVADWKCGDEPFPMEWEGGRIMSIPYSVDLNDITTIGYQNHTSEEFAGTIRRQFDVLYKEGQASGKVMAIGLHPYIIGVPHRIGHFAEALDYVAGHDKVWFATGSEIIDAYLQQLT